MPACCRPRARRCAPSSGTASPEETAAGRCRPRRSAAAHTVRRCSALARECPAPRAVEGRAAHTRAETPSWARTVWRRPRVHRNQLSPRTGCSKGDADANLGTVQRLAGGPAARHAAQARFGAQREIEKLISHADGQMRNRLPVGARLEPRAVVVAADTHVGRYVERPLPRGEATPVRADTWQPTAARGRSLEGHARLRKLHRRVEAEPHVAGAPRHAEALEQPDAALRRDRP